jgi:hypothetical protein
MSHAAVALASYLRPYVERIEDFYQWSFNEVTAARVTHRKYSRGRNWYTKTLRLKRDLRRLLRKSKTHKQRVRIAGYFIKEWGRVTSNKNLEGIIKEFTAVIRRGKGRDAFRNIDLDGVSSWSKYISLCCDWAAIYDSRVAYSINAIRYIKGDIEQFFPIPEGRSPRLNLIDIETLFVLSLLKKGTLELDEELQYREFSARVKTQFHVEEQRTYDLYLNLLSDTTEQLCLPPNEFFKVEMLLFWLAPNQVLSDLVEHLRTRPTF